MVQFVVNSCVVGMIVGCEHTVFDERSHVGGSQGFAETHIVVALVCGKAPTVACVPQGDIRADPCSIRPLRATVEVSDRAVSGIHEKRRLDRVY
jgi:hypothetical protein